MRNKLLQGNIAFHIQLTVIIALALYVLFSLVIMVLDWQGELFYANHPVAILFLGPLLALSHFVWVLREFGELRTWPINPPALITAGCIFFAWITGAISLFAFTHLHKSVSSITASIILLITWPLTGLYVGILLSDSLFEAILAYCFLALGTIALSVFMHDIRTPKNGVQS